MKKVIVTIVLALALLAPAHAQRFIGYLAAGANFSQIEGDDVHGFYKVGVNAGPGVMLPLGRKQNMSISAELLFTQKGSRCSYRRDPFDTLLYAPSMYEDVNRAIPFDSTVKCRMSLDYIQIPVIFRYEDMRSGCFIGAGFAWSRLVRAKEIYNGFTRTTTARSKTFKTSDWSFLADINIRLYKNLSLNFRYEYSLAPIRTMDFTYVRTDGSTYTETYKLHNHVITTRLVYYINEKFYKNTRVNKDGQRKGTPWLREIPESND